jgi:hypothetical protein
MRRDTRTVSGVGPTVRLHQGCYLGHEDEQRTPRSSFRKGRRLELHRTPRESKWHTTCGAANRHRSGAPVEPVTSCLHGVDEAMVA